MNTYYKSKPKIYALICVCIFILVLTMFFAWLVLDIISVRVMCIGTLIFGVGLFISRITPQFQQIVHIRDNSIYFTACYDKVHNPPIDVKIMCNEIIELSYKGTKIIPMSEMMVISTENEKIYIDFNFKNHLNLWDDIVNVCEKNSPHVEIDQRLYKRLKKLETK